MYYHPIIGILIFLIAVVLSFILGRHLMQSRRKDTLELNNTSLPKGEVTSPDAPWLNKNKNQK